MFIFQDGTTTDYDEFRTEVKLFAKHESIFNIENGYRASLIIHLKDYMENFTEVIKLSSLDHIAKIKEILSGCYFTSSELPPEEYIKLYKYLLLEFLELRNQAFFQ